MRQKEQKRAYLGSLYPKNKVRIQISNIIQQRFTHSISAILLPGSKLEDLSVLIQQGCVLSMVTCFEHEYERYLEAVRNMAYFEKFINERVFHNGDVYELMTTLYPIKHDVIILDWDRPRMVKDKLDITFTIPWLNEGGLLFVSLHNKPRRTKSQYVGSATSLSYEMKGVQSFVEMFTLESGELHSYSG